MKCHQCGVETYMAFRCPYCDQYSCVEHRLPENHNCSEYWRARAPRKESVKPLKSEPSYKHTITMMPSQLARARGKIIWFSLTELKHLLIGTLLTMAIGFSMPLYWDQGLYSEPLVLTALAIIFTFSFITHELAHKIAAQHHGLWAEFRITMFGALITLLSIISPFKIISPGAVMVGGAADRRTIGRTSIVGPLTNIVLALLFIILARLPSGPLAFAFAFGVLINSFIALFNLIPFGVLDGFKVFFWSKMIWAIAFSASLILTVYSYMAFPIL
ncbi:MAG: hypothetical protein JSV51_09960 [Candidatus Bathyarchaeota archaeon]|nr:MAG: hypothetical protein JSV51_09960 [Candidatus Bathyarchaeota archaeon]